MPELAAADRDKREKGGRGLMGRKGADRADLAKALRAPAFDRNTGDTDLSPANTLAPVSPTTLVLPIAMIRPYERNPRRAQNPEYDRLKDSIRSRGGLTTPLTVTRRPGDECYTVAAGGNSRLRALRELYEDTGDEVFGQVTCQFEPWGSDCQVLANHLIENDVRGNLIFADKARAVLEWRALFEAEHPEAAPLSQRGLADHLAAAGFHVPQSLLSRLIYTAEYLLPCLPKALASGMVRSQIELIIRLRTLAEQYWNDTVKIRGASTDVAFEEVFTEVCVHEDRHHEDWLQELFQSALAVKMAEALGRDHKLVALEIDSLCHGIPITRSSESEPIELTETPDRDGPKSEWAFERAREFEAIKAERAEARRTAKARATGEQHTEAHEPSEPISVSMPTPPAELDTEADIHQLRRHNFATAQWLAARHGLEALVKPCDLGFGYFIDAPEPPEGGVTGRPVIEKRPVSGVVLSGTTAWVWWLLCLAAEQLAEAHLEALRSKSPESWLPQLFLELPKRRPGTDPMAALHILVGTPDLQNLCPGFLTSNVPAREDHAGLNRLFEGCRCLRAEAERTQVTLWGAGP